MTHLTTLILALSSALLLTGCGQQASAATELRVVSVVPSTLTPGETVTVYGTLPAGTSAQLDESPLMSVPVSGGLRFNLPETLTAGHHTLTVQAAGQRLSLPLVIHPRLTSAAFDGQSLIVRGAGWTRESLDLRVEVDRTLFTPEVLDTERLRVPLPRAQAYGPVTLRLWSSGQDSAVQVVTREAGAARGRVTLPGQTVQRAHAPLQEQTRLQAPPQRRLLVMVTGEQHLPEDLGAVQREEEPSLHVTRLTFATSAQASGALERLRLLPGVTATYDSPLRLDDAAPAFPGRLPQFQAQASAPTPDPTQWHLARLGLSDAWARTTGQGVVVAVVDTGILGSHPDLQGQLLPGFNFVDGNVDTTDTYGHGTHVAGLIAAHGRVLGVAPGASLLPVRVIRDQGGGSAFDVARGVLYAANLLPERPNPNPAQVINLSLGLDGASPLIEEAVSQAMDRGVIVVAAAGNTGGALASPANVPGVLSVTALSGPDTTYVPAYANGGEGLQLASFGGDLSQDQDRDGTPDGLMSTDRQPDGTPGYRLRNGTSMAAPLVSGLAALSLASGTPAALVSGVLKATATDLYVPGYDLTTGMGLPTGRAVTLARPRTYVIALDASGHLAGWTAAQADGQFLLGNLPPGESLDLIAVVDTNGDGTVGQVGDEQSPPQRLEVQAAALTDVQFGEPQVVAIPHPISLLPHP